MYPRTNFEMTEADLETIMAACKPVPAIMLHIPGSARSPQENANDAWAALGKRMGFDAMTVRPIEGKGNRFFTAVPSETEGERQEREKKEAAERVKARVEQLRTEIKSKEQEIAALLTT